MPLSKQHWFIRYKLYHIPFWFVYHMVLWTILTGSPVVVIKNIFTPYGIKFLFYVIFQALGVYFNLYVLIPRLLEKGKPVQYLAAVTLTTLGIAAAIVPGYFLSSRLSGIPMTDLYGADGNSFRYFFQVNTLASTVAAMTLGMSLKFAKNWLETRNRAREMEKEKLEAELKFLKSQLNPHFFFNTINSIFVLINQNPAMAQDTLARFSDLLRYQLYECNENEIPLEQELQFLTNFIALEKIRHETDLTIAVTYPVITDGKMIAPFVLLPFIENAFKHVAHSMNQPGHINIGIELHGHSLQLRVENSFDRQQRAVHAIAFSGIGLINVRRRLDLLYPGKHQLIIEESGQIFSASLELELSPITSPVKTIAP